MGSLGGVRLFLAFVGVIVAVAFAAVAGYGHARAGSGDRRSGDHPRGPAGHLRDPSDGRPANGWVAAGELLRTVAGAIAMSRSSCAGAGLLPFTRLSFTARSPGSRSTAWLVSAQDATAADRRLGESGVSLRRHALLFACHRGERRLLSVAIILVSSSPMHTRPATRSLLSRDRSAGLRPVLLVGAAFPIFARAARDDHARALLCRRPYVRGGLDRRSCPGARTGGGRAVHHRSGRRATVPSRRSGVAHTGADADRDLCRRRLGLHLLSLHRHRQVLVVSLLALALTVVLTATLASVDGARGAAIGTTTSGSR